MTLRMPAQLSVVTLVLALVSFMLSVTANYQQICDAISATISAESAVYHPGSASYAKDVLHFAISSTQQSTCTVEPGTAEDLGKILQILGKTRTPFSIKSGGHAMNPGFSSSPAVQIVMYRFNEVNYDQQTQTVVIGTGLIFDDIYDALAPHNVSVAGGRVAGIGMGRVGGFLLGGGYGWKTNQYGLAIDTIVGYELVTPDGEVVKVTEQSDSELFFGLKGGLNNFGIVTRFSLKALPQPAIWAGAIMYPHSSEPQVTAAVLNFSATNTDPKANILPSYSYYDNQLIISLLVYYDDPSPPAGLFDDFLKIPSTISDIKERTLSDFISIYAANITVGLRGVLHTVPILEYTPSIIIFAFSKGIAQFWSTALVDEISIITYNVEPFLPSILNHNTAPTAYPPTRTKPYSPLSLYYAWVNPDLDNKMYDVVRWSAARIRDAGIAEGQAIANAPLYPNYAIFGTPLEEMYGDNVGRLKSLRKRVDPLDVMGLAGGFKF